MREADTDFILMSLGTVKWELAHSSMSKEKKTYLALLLEALERILNGNAQVSRSGHEETSADEVIIPLFPNGFISKKGGKKKMFRLRRMSPSD